jgi:ABC-type nitrate/sulfonate/bicarbonate transport system permease component
VIALALWWVPQLGRICERFLVVINAIPKITLAPILIVLFGVKMVLFPAYVAAVVLLLDVRSTAFVVSFTAQMVLLYGLEALHLRRLFAGAP